MSLDLYYIPASPPCRAVIATAKFINKELNLKHLNLFQKEHLKPEFLKLNPQHTVPTLVDDGFALWESRAIIQYLINKYAPDSDIYPKDPKERAVVDRLLYFDIGTLYKAEVDWFLPQLLLGQPADPEKEKAMKEKLQLLNEQLEGKQYVAGDKLTIADFSIMASVTHLHALDYDLSSFTNINNWLNQLKADLPFYDEVVTEPIEQARQFIKSRQK